VTVLTEPFLCRSSTWRHRANGGGPAIFKT
jgi:hypothetical protein